MPADRPDRILFVDGPLRGWDIPNPGGFRIVVPGWDAVDPLRPVQHGYVMRPVRDAHDHPVLLAFYEDTTYAR